MFSKLIIRFRLFAIQLGLCEADEKITSNFNEISGICLCTGSINGGSHNSSHTVTGRLRDETFDMISGLVIDKIGRRLVLFAQSSHRSSLKMDRKTFRCILVGNLG